MLFSRATFQIQHLSFLDAVNTTEIVDKNDVPNSQNQTKEKGVGMPLRQAAETRTVGKPCKFLGGK